MICPSRLIPGLLCLVPALAFCAPEKTTRRLRFAFWERPSARVQLAIAEEKKILPIRPYTMCFMDEVNYAGTNTPTLLRKVESAAADKTGPQKARDENKEEWVACGSINLGGATSSHCDVLLVPSGANTWTGYAFDVGEKNFPWGGVRLINLTADHLSGTFNGRPVKAAPQQQVLLPYVFQKEEPEVGMLILSKQDSDGPKTVISNPGMFSGKTRTTLFLIQNNSTPNQVRHETRSIVETKPEKEIEMPALRTPRGNIGKK